MRNKPIQHEAIHQRALIQWANIEARQRPELALLFAIPNGGKRDARTAAFMKAEGVKAGVPDLFLPVARNGFHGLFIEMKAPNGRPSLSQKQWGDSLTFQGYLAAICIGWEEARLLLLSYLAENPHQERNL